MCLSHQWSTVLYISVLCVSGLLFYICMCVSVLCVSSLLFQIYVCLCVVCQWSTVPYICVLCVSGLLFYIYVCLCIVCQSSTVLSVDTQHEVRSMCVIKNFTFFYFLFHDKYHWMEVCLLIVI